MKRAALTASLPTLVLTTLVLAACGGPKVISRLDCPEKEGRLKRLSASADGRACAYRAADGTDIALKLLALNGSPAATLKPIELALTTEAAPATAVKTTATDEEETVVSLPGLHVRAKGDDAEVNVGPMKIDASDGNAEIRLQRDVRLKGQALSPKKDGFRSSFLLAGDKLKGDFAFVGYEAAGPKSGPIVAAVFKSKAGERSHSDDDISRLVRRNAGV